MNIYINIEVKRREFNSRMLLAFFAASKGHTVYVVNQLYIVTMLKYLKPGIVFDKSITPNPFRIKALKSYYKNNHLITSIDEESGLLDESYDEFAKFRYSDETLKLSSKVFCWGKHDYSSLINIYPNHIDKIVMTGSPRTDLWGNKFDKFYNHKKKKFKYILIPSNFGAIMSSNQLWSLIDNYKKTKVNIKKFDEFGIYSRLSFQIELLGSFLKLIKHLSLKYPKIKIIIKPHPTETYKAWTALVEKSDNVIIDYEEDLTSLIRNASLIIHNGCTTGLESAVSNIPTVVFKPIESIHERKVPNSFGIEVNNYSQIEEFLENIFNKKNYDVPVNRVPRIGLKNIILIDKDLACNNIISEWEKLKDDNLNKKNNILLIKLLYIYSKIRIYLSIYKNKFFSNSGSTFNDKLIKFTPMNKNEVFDLYSGYKECVDISDNLKINLINPNILEVK